MNMCRFSSAAIGDRVECGLVTKCAACRKTQCTPPMVSIVNPPPCGLHGESPLWFPWRVHPMVSMVSAPSLWSPWRVLPYNGLHGECPLPMVSMVSPPMVSMVSPPYGFHGECLLSMVPMVSPSYDLHGESPLWSPW